MRDPITDSEAIAAMPGLESIAEVVAEQRPRKRKGRSDPLAQVILCGVARAFGSQEKAASALRHGGLWERVRASAARVGRDLPEAPPTADQIDHLLRSGPDGLEPASLTEPMERAFNVEAVGLARQMGLFDPQAPLAFDPPLRQHHITGDGTVTKPLSEVTDENKRHRSRAADPESGARVCETAYGKTEGDAQGDTRPLGLPFVVASTHMGRQHGRVVLGLQVYMDGAEIDASMGVFRRVLPLANGGIHTVHYDRLMRSTHVLELSKLGAISIVEKHKAAESHRQALDVSDDPARSVRRRSKTRVSATDLGAFHHKAAGSGRDCWAHRLWSINGQLRITSQSQREPTWDAAPLTLLGVHRRRLADRYAIDATYRLPCERCGGVDLTIDLAKDPRGYARDTKALRNASAQRIRLINEQDGSFWQVAGRRSDSESTVATIKRMMPLHGRASRLRAGAYLWDLLGTALVINAQAWDVHVAQHTPSGAAIYARQQAAEMVVAA